MGEAALEELLVMLAADVGLLRAIALIDEERRKIVVPIGEFRAGAPDLFGNGTRSPHRVERSQPLRSEAEIGKAIIDLPGAGNKLRRAERAAVRHLLALFEGRVTAAARMIGIGRKSLERRARALGIPARRRS